jgi:hypothetical protein
MDDGNPATELIPRPDPSPLRPQRRKHIIIALVCGIFVFGLATGAYIFLRSRSPQDDTSRNTSPSATTGNDTELKTVNPVPGYDSAIGLLPPFHEGRIRSGKFSVRYSSLGQNIVEREGEFTVNGDGRVGFAMIHNVEKVNSVLTYLSEREGDAELYQMDDLLATKYVSFNFADIAGYPFFYDPLTIVGGQFSEIAWAKEHPGTEWLEHVTLGAACDKAYARALSLSSGMALSTANMTVGVKRDGETYTVQLDNGKFRQAHAALEEMIGACYDYDPTDQILNNLLPGLAQQSDVASHITYRKLDDNRWRIEIPQPEAEAFTLTVWDLSDRPLAQDSVAISSYARKISQYGIAYDLCRLPPVMTSDFGRSYDFMPESGTYSLPTLFYSGYYCAPSLVPQGYSASSFYLKDGKESVAYITDTNLTRLQTVVQLRHVAEEHYLTHGYYPSWAELFRSVQGDEYFASALRQELRVERIAYRPLPDGCSGKSCQDFEASLELGNGTLFFHSFEHGQ